MRRQPVELNKELEPILPVDLQAPEAPGIPAAAAGAAGKDKPAESPQAKTGGEPAGPARRARKRGRGRWASRRLGGRDPASTAAAVSVPSPPEAGAAAESAASPPQPDGQAPRRVLVDAKDPEELRIAVLEGDSLEELYFERTEDKKYLGNLYKGRVVNLEPAIQAVFVEIGIGRNGFLHVSDVLPIYAGASSIPIESLSQRPSERRRLRIQDILHKGQEILVQISKDSIGAKGPSLTTYVSLPGKYLVLMPGISRFGVSKRILDGGERAKLRESLSSLDPPKGLGYIIRTAGKDKPREILQKDLKNLVEVWNDITAKVKSLPSPALIYQETDLLSRALRDICGPEVGEILVNDEESYHRIREFLQGAMPQSEKLARLYTGTLPLFSKFGVEEEIEKIYNRRVPLPSGGYLVIEQTEALVAIDVNSGKFREEEDLEDTALKTNLEAAVEIARQLRLRDLGGVIVNDFIDMIKEENRREVERAFRAALKRDRAKCWLSRISRFGIIEMTRQRVRPSLERATYEPCKHCRGLGVVKSARAVGTAVMRQLQVGLAIRKKEIVEVAVHPEVQNYLLNQRRKQINDMEEHFRKSIEIFGDPGYAPDQFEIRYR